MEEFGSLWSYQEGMDELKQKLLYATLELESVKLEANQENVKNKESVRNLLNLLQMAYKERDEAKNQVQKLLNKLMVSQFQAESPVFIPTAKANSSITESNSLSDTYNPHSHGSPADSFFDTVSSPDFSNINMADSATISAAGFGNQPFVLPECNEKMDPTAFVIEDIAKGKKLPEKGRLLEAVMDAGPLLQTLLVAGPLPRWRNPPPLVPFKIPPVLMKGGGGGGDHMANFEEKPVVGRMCSTSMLNFSGAAAAASSDSRFNNGMMMMISSSSSAPSSSFGSQILLPSAKRQRFY